MAWPRPSLGPLCAQMPRRVSQRRSPQGGHLGNPSVKVSLVALTQMVSNLTETTLSRTC